jgi:hypothetical protein
MIPATMASAIRLWPHAARRGTLPGIIDEYGLPRGAHGLTDVPGLASLGLVWQRHLLSISMPGAVADGRYLATEIGLTPERQTV